MFQAGEHIRAQHVQKNWVVHGPQRIVEVCVCCELFREFSGVLLGLLVCTGCVVPTPQLSSQPDPLALLPSTTGNISG